LRSHSQTTQVDQIFDFIGLKNYMVAFTDQNFLSYLLVTFEFMTITVIFQIGLGLGFAFVAFSKL